MRTYAIGIALALLCATSSADGQSATAEVYRDIGNTLMRRGRTTEAVKSYEDALRVRPDFDDARRGLGLALMKLKRHDAAEREFRKIVRSRPNDANAHYDLGSALSARGKHEDALTAYREALRLQPGHATARLAIVSTLTELGRAGEAISTLSDAPRSDEPPAVRLARRARAAHTAGRHAEAVLFWTQALEAEPGYFDTREAERAMWNASVAALSPRPPATSAQSPRR